MLARAPAGTKRWHLWATYEDLQVRLMRWTEGGRGQRAMGHGQHVQGAPLLLEGGGKVKGAGGQREEGRTGQ